MPILPGDLVAHTALLSGPFGIVKSTDGITAVVNWGTVGFPQRNKSTNSVLVSLLVKVDSLQQPAQLL